VLVREGEVIGEGRHAVYGQAHAEVNAITACRNAGLDPAGATAYVTLAPCTRHGRQPPCVEALVAARVARVVVAVEDPNQDDPRNHLGPAGIIYETGCLHDVAAHLHGGFLTRMALGRPRFTGKWAMTLDGCIAAAGGDAGWISSPEALALSRRRRRCFDAILVGSGTVKNDDPRLLSTVPGERTPVRVVVSRTAAMASDATLAATSSQAPVLMVHGPDAQAWRLTALHAARVETLLIGDPHDPQEVAVALAKRGLNDVLVEGGSHIHGAWLRAGLYDRLEIYSAALTLGGGLPVCAGVGVTAVKLGTRWLAEGPPRLLGDTVCWRLKKPGRVMDQAPVVVI
jgi:diaminohydroxyphosphoribosylaminopyrimidine deaminase/5-amino-6-(5-phosphoribosylamino)uracil reductase